MPAAMPQRPPVALVVDDHDDVRETLRCVLSRWGIDVATACNGAEALHCLEQGLAPGLIFLDLQMPVMDGPTFFGHLRAMHDTRLASTPVVVLTASRERELPGAAHTLRKPYALDDIEECVQRFCRH